MRRRSWGKIQPQAKELGWLTGLRPAVGKGRDGWQKNTSKNIKDLHSAAAQGKRTARRRLVKVGAAFHCIQIKISNIIQ